MQQPKPCLLILIALLLLLPAVAVAGNGHGNVILISLDGFRADYLELSETPNFDQLAAGGVRAEALIPCFPTKTFPNHYTIVTGLYPANHGIIANQMYDPKLDAYFDIYDRESILDPRWWGGEPVWVTVQRAGLASASCFWVGTEAPIKGKQPQYWLPYQHNMPNEKRVEQVLTWLDLPEAERPIFITMYFALLDDIGHQFGAAAPEVLQAVNEVDRIIGRLLKGLRQRQLFDRINIMIVSDHGMVDISPERVLFIEDYIDLGRVDIINWSPVATINPQPDYRDEAYDALKHANQHLLVYRREEIPQRFRYSGNARIPEIIAVAESGWTIATHEKLAENPHWYSGGTHGYDNQLPEMHGLFIASGPAFRQGVVVEKFVNVEVYNLIMKALKLPPASNDGRLANVEGLLRPDLP